MFIFPLKILWKNKKNKNKNTNKLKRKGIHVIQSVCTYTDKCSVAEEFYYFT